MVSAAASAAAAAMVLRENSFVLKLKGFFSRFSNELTLVIEQFDDSSINQTIKPNSLKLQSFILNPESHPMLKESKSICQRRRPRFYPPLKKIKEIVDIFNGVQLKCKLGSKQAQEQVF